MEGVIPSATHPHSGGYLAGFSDSPSSVCGIHYDHVQLFAPMANYPEVVGDPCDLNDHAAVGNLQTLRARIDSPDGSGYVQNS